MKHLRDHYFLNKLPSSCHLLSIYYSQSYVFAVTKVHAFPNCLLVRELELILTLKIQKYFGHNHFLYFNIFPLSYYHSHFHTTVITYSHLFAFVIFHTYHSLYTGIPTHERQQILSIQYTYAHTTLRPTII